MTSPRNLLAAVSLLGAAAAAQEASPRAAAPGGLAPTELLARTDGGFAVAGDLAARGTVVVPTVTRSEVLVRSVRESRGHRFRLADLGGALARDAVRAERVRHLASEQVVLADDGPWLVGEPRLPLVVADASGARGAPDWITALARRDGSTCSSAVTLELDAREGERLVLVSADAEDATVGWRTSSGAAGSWVLPGTACGNAAAIVAVPSGELVLDPRGCRLDQVTLAEARPIESSERAPTALLGDAPDELALAPGTGLAAGEVETFLIHADREALAARGGHSAPSAVAPVPASTPVALFRDASAELGVHFVHLEGPDEQLDIRPTMGPGVAWGDVDRDGWNDLYLVQGAGREDSRTPTNRLLSNLGGSQGFRDATAELGGGDSGAGMGALFFEADGDGFLDLYVANYGDDVLFANRARGSARRLEDATEAAGVAVDGWSAGIAAGDLDLDGDLDLYVTRYLRYDEAALENAAELRHRRDDPVAMLPFAFPGDRNVFLRNESDSAGVRFIDATDALELADEHGRGMQPVFWDFDRDGALDLYVANDVSENRLWQGGAEGGLRDVGFAAGMDDPRGGMGVAVGDVDSDGDEDLLLTNWDLEPNALYLNHAVRHAEQRHRVGTFTDASVRSGLGPHGIGVTSWGAELGDLDLDGDLDLFVANGYTSPDYASTGICVGQPDHLFLGDGEGRFTAAHERAGPDVARALPSRALAACDFDRDGDLDLVVTANNGPTRVLVNQSRESGDGGSWLAIRLRGRAPNPDGIGAWVTVEAAGREHTRELRAGTSYLAGNAPELHVGLGNLPAGAPALVRVRWPSGATSARTLEGVDRLVVLDEPR